MKHLTLLVCLGLITTIGCGKTETVEVETPTVETTDASFITLCKNCGEVKESEKCCAAGAESCDCGFHKGSPACCKAKKGDEDIKLCAKCGQVAGTDECCEEGAETCSCGFVKGSPACCKVDKTTLTAIVADDDEGDSHEAGDNDEAHEKDADGHDHDEEGHHDEEGDGHDEDGEDHDGAEEEK